MDSSSSFLLDSFVHLRIVSFTKYNFHTIALQPDQLSCNPSYLKTICLHLYMHNVANKQKLGWRYLNGVGEVGRGRNATCIGDNNQTQFSEFQQRSRVLREQIQFQFSSFNRTPRLFPERKCMYFIYCSNRLVCPLDISGFTRRKSIASGL